MLPPPPLAELMFHCGFTLRIYSPLVSWAGPSVTPSRGPCILKIDTISRSRLRDGQVLRAKYVDLVYILMTLYIFLKTGKDQSS